MPDSLIKNVVIPVADEEDARTTAQELYSDEFDRVTAVHVVEKREAPTQRLGI